MRPGAAILSRLMMMMFLLLVLRLECCSKYDCLFKFVQVSYSLY